MPGTPPAQGSRRRMRVPDVQRVLAVASGKGGVGKSTVAVNLALALARHGLRVGLLDADVHGPDVPLMLGVRRREAVTGWEAIVPLGSGPAGSQSSRLPALERYGIRMMSLGLLVGEDQPTLVANVALAGLLIRSLLTQVEWGVLDVLLIDFPPGTGEPQATLLETVHLDGALLVVTPQDVARLDTTRALHAFQAARVPLLGIVENMSYLRCPKCGERIEVFHRGRVAREISSGRYPLLAEIPLEPAISAAADSGRPVVIADPRGRQAAVFLELAAALLRRLDEVGKP